MRSKDVGSRSVAFIIFFFLFNLLVCSSLFLILYTHGTHGYIFFNLAVLDLGLISIGSLGPRASTKVESHVNFTESQKVSQPNFLQ